MTASVRVWLKFNAVGLIGAGVQLISLSVLKSLAGLHYLRATAMAVEIAVLHNFVWHERWTWAERTRLIVGGAFGRLVRFHLANGLISILGNLIVTWFFVSQFRVNYFIANIVAIGICSILNFLASDRLVFRTAWGDRGIHR